MERRIDLRLGTVESIKALNKICIEEGARINFSVETGWLYVTYEEEIEAKIINAVSQLKLI